MVSASGPYSLVRLNTNGSLDTSFGVGGFYTDSRLTWGGPIVVQPGDDEIVMTGELKEPSRRCHSGARGWIILRLNLRD